MSGATGATGATAPPSAVAHDGLAWQAALRYARLSSPGCDRDDLIQSARLGLMRATELWDPAAGKAFAPYAAAACRAAVIRELRNRRHTVRTPVFQHERGVRPRRAISLDAPMRVDDPESSTRLELLACDGPLPGETIDDDRRREALRAAIEALPARERRIILGRLDGKSLRAVAAELGLSAERCRQLECAALARLKRALRALA